MSFTCRPRGLAASHSNEVAATGLPTPARRDPNGALLAADISAWPRGHRRRRKEGRRGGI